MITFKVTTNELEKLVRDNSRFLRKVHDRKRVLETIKDVQTQRWELNFDSKGSEYEAWAPSRRGLADTLVDSGRMRRNVFEQQQDADLDSSTITWAFSNDEDSSSFPVSHHTGYSLTNNYGHTNVIPSRRLWDFDSQDESRMTENLETWLEQLADEVYG